MAVGNIQGQHRFANGGQRKRGSPVHSIPNNRSVCFHGEQDYQFYLHTLKEFADKFGCALHAYVLMTNHVHLLLTPAREGSAGLMMKHF